MTTPKHHDDVAVADGRDVELQLTSLQSAHIRNRSTMAVDAQSAIREAIIFGEIPAGAPLRLEHVAESLRNEHLLHDPREGVHRRPVLDLESIPYRGSRVTRLDLDEMRDVYELRLAVETVSVRRVAAHIDESEVNELADLLDRLDQTNKRGDVRGGVMGNSEFHAQLAAASGSPWVTRTLRPLLETTQRYGAFVQRSHHRTESIDIESKSSPTHAPAPAPNTMRSGRSIACSSRRIQPRMRTCIRCRRHNGLRKASAELSGRPMSST